MLIIFYVRTLSSIFNLCSLAVKECNKPVPEGGREPDDRDEGDRVKPNPGPPVNPNPKCPTPKGKTCAVIDKICNDKIKNDPLAKECKKILGEDFEKDIENFVKNCKDDIMVCIKITNIYLCDLHLADISTLFPLKFVTL